MTWNTLTDLADEQVVTEEHMDDIRENIEHLGSMTAWGTALSALSGSDETVGTTGTYTGDGAATKAITGIGFQPQYLLIFAQVASASQLGFKSDQDTTYTYGPAGYQQDHIISLDSNGFTVGDGTGSSNYFNVNARVYTYVAFGTG